jgi:hypothetical protein
MDQKGILDLSTKALKGVAILGGVAFLGYLVYRLYIKTRDIEAEGAPPKPLVVPVTPINPPKVKKSKPVKATT